MENEVNQIIEEIFKSLETSLPRKNAQVERAVARTRLAVADILIKHTSSDGTVPLNKISAVTNELVAVEGEIYRNLRTELQMIIEGVADETTITLAEAIVSIIGLLLLIEIGGLPKVLADLSVGVVEAVFSALTGSSYRQYRDSVTSSTFNRKEHDGLILNDRLRNIAAALRKEIEVTLRESIRKGEGTAEILRKLDKRYDGMDWRLDSIVETEVMFAMRQVIAKFAGESGIVKALKIVDFPTVNLQFTNDINAMYMHTPMNTAWAKVFIRLALER